MRFEEDSESVVTGTFYDDNIAVMDVWLNMVLVEVIFWHWISLRAVIACRETNLTRRDFAGRVEAR